VRGPHYDFLAAEDCLQRADVKFDDVTGKIADGGDGTLQLSYGGGYGVLTLAFFRSAQEAADTKTATPRGCEIPTRGCRGPA
jgi:hypothetical protein